MLVSSGRATYPGKRRGSRERWRPGTCPLHMPSVSPQHPQQPNSQHRLSRAPTRSHSAPTGARACPAASWACRRPRARRCARRGRAGGPPRAAPGPRPPAARSWAPPLLPADYREGGWGGGGGGGAMWAGRRGGVERGVNGGGGGDRGGGGYLSAIDRPALEGGGGSGRAAAIGWGRGRLAVGGRRSDALGYCYLHQRRRVCLAMPLSTGRPPPRDAIEKPGKASHHALAGDVGHH